MDVHTYIAQKKELYDLLIDFLDSEDDEDINFYEDLIYSLDNLKQEEDQEEIKSFLRLIIQISHNHHRNSFFDSKIDQILTYFSKYIKQTLSNSEIFSIFKSNKRILLFLITQKLLILDDSILDFFLNNVVYRLYFSTEIKPKISPEKLEKYYSKSLNIDSFEEKRKKGQNDTYICELIRNDNVSDFISHVTAKNVSLSTSLIRPSIFEMNLLLNEKKPTLIEYAAFFGSIQILKFLQFNNVELEPSLWLYSIHSKNAELIHFLEENHVHPPNDSYEKCLIEAIKCHHNDIANYIQENLIIKSDTKLSDEVLEAVLRYYNYAYFPDDLNHELIFFDLVQFNYLKIVDLLIEMKKNEFEETIILKAINFFIQFHHFIFLNKILKMCFVNYV